MDCILKQPKLVVSINYTWNLDTPSGSQNEEANSRNSVAWFFGISLHRDKTSLQGVCSNKGLYCVKRTYEVAS